MKYSDDDIVAIIVKLREAVKKRIAEAELKDLSRRLVSLRDVKPR